MELETQEQRMALYLKYPAFFEDKIGKHWTAKKLAIATMYLQGGTTLEKVGKEYGISKERVRQIVVNFLRQVASIYMRNKTTFRAMETKQQPLSEIDKLDTALVKFGDMLRSYIKDELQSIIEDSVRRQVDMLMATKYPSRLTPPITPPPVEEEKNTPARQGDASLPEMSDPEAGDIIGYYVEDIKAYLGSDEKFADFEEWYRGKTGGIYQGNFYVFKYDFQEYLGNSVPDTKKPTILTHWTIDEVEVALDARQDEIHEVADLLNRTYDAVKSLRWRYRMFKNGQGNNNMTQGTIKLIKQYEKLKGGEKQTWTKKH